MLTLTTLVPVAVAVALTLGGLATGLVIRRRLIPRLLRAADQSTWHGHDVLVVAARGPFPLWTTLLGAYVATDVTPLPGSSGPAARQVLVVLLVLSITWYLGQVAAAAMTQRAGALGRLPAVNLVSNVTRSLVVGLRADRLRRGGLRAGRNMALHHDSPAAEQRRTQSGPERPATGSTRHGPYLATTPLSR